MAGAAALIGNSPASGSIESLHEVPGLGDQARQLSNGLFEVKLDDGTLLHTHGFDPAPVQPSSSAGAGVPGGIVPPVSVRTDGVIPDAPDLGQTISTLETEAAQVQQEANALSGYVSDQVNSIHIYHEEPPPPSSDDVFAAIGLVTQVAGKTLADAQALVESIHIYHEEPPPPNQDDVNKAVDVVEQKANQMLAEVEALIAKANDSIAQITADPVGATDGPISTVDAPVAQANDDANQTSDNTIDTLTNGSVVPHAVPNAAYGGLPPACASSSSRAFVLVYTYPKDAPAAVKSTGNQSARQEELRGSVYRANQQLYQSGSDSSKAETSRLYRFRCNSNATLRVIAYQSSTTRGSDSFDQIVQSARARGLSDPNTKYVMYYDDPFTARVNGLVPCGLGSLEADDRKSTANANNNGASYAMVFSGCLSQSTVMHEMGHTMGAVQRSAPHSTAYGHCWDQYDVMCYDDGGTPHGMRTICPASQEQYDCNFDDYYDTKPETGEYLASHWNQGWTGNSWLSPVTPAKLSVNDASVQEGGLNETTKLRFTVTLSADLGDYVFVDYYTSDGTATAGSDYDEKQGTLEFAPGVTKRYIDVTVHGDVIDEADETLLVHLKSPTGATITKAKGTGTIVNDDTGFRTACRAVLGPNPICDTNPLQAALDLEPLLEDPAAPVPDSVALPDLGV
jgi:hypothetical protein